LLFGRKNRAGANGPVAPPAAAAERPLAPPPPPPAEPAPAASERSTPEAQAPAVSEEENLRRWKASGQPRAWVEAHHRQWNHDDWLALLAELERSPFWPLRPEAVGQTLEDTRREMRAPEGGALGRPGCLLDPPALGAP
jgi:hypothetical protein